MNNTSININFWGVRGSCSVSREDNLLYGSNTACIEISVGKTLIIFDAGTGINKLGERYKNEHLNAHIFLSHYHLDHIQGLPFFSPLFSPNNSFTIYGETKNNTSVEKILTSIFKPPYFPLQLNNFGSKITFFDVDISEIITIGDNIQIEPFKLNHPGGSLGYKLIYNNKSIVYLSDIEHNNSLTSNISSFVNNCDLLIYDANYTNEEYFGKKDNSPKIGWGHSTWEEGVKLAKIANVKQLVLFHHDINRTDEDMLEIECEAKTHFCNTIAAKEGLNIII